MPSSSLKQNWVDLLWTFTGTSALCPTSSGSGKKLTLGLKENCCNIWCCNLKATSRGASHTLTSQILTKTTNSLTHAKICSSAVTSGESIHRVLHWTHIWSLDCLLNSQMPHISWTSVSGTLPLAPCSFFIFPMLLFNLPSLSRFFFSFHFIFSLKFWCKGIHIPSKCQRKDCHNEILSVQIKSYEEHQFEVTYWRKSFLAITEGGWNNFRTIRNP